MISKFLEKRVEVEMGEDPQQNRNAMELEYYLLEIETDAGEQELKKAYGIEILKKQQGIHEEKKKYQDVFCSRERTKNLVEQLAENTVTPVTLPYILDDILGI